MKCCGAPKGAQDVKDAVRSAYGAIAEQGGSCCQGAPSCCGASGPDALARALGYSEEELAALPEGANMGLSCGNPTALASLRPGEVVLDLGSGGGLDVFVAAGQVGPMGRAIGVDMTPGMVSRARRNAVAFAERTGLRNVEFRLGEIEHLPVADACVDVVISNCVINLSPEKPQVWREIARVLKPGGRVAVSDLGLVQPLPEAVRGSVEALIGCVAGAALVVDTGPMVRQAGLTDVRLEEDAAAVESMTQSNGALFQQLISLLPQGRRPSDYVVSLKVTARRPA